MSEFVYRDQFARAVSLALDYTQNLRGSKICITGASGFLAANLVAFLSELDRIGALEMKIFAYARRPLSAVPLFSFLGIEPRGHWINAAAEGVTLPKEPDLIVIHTASYGSPRDYLREPLTTYSANVNGLIHLFEQQSRMRQFIYFSSAEVYGQPTEASIPTKENFIGGVDTLSLRSIYAESKRMAEVLGICYSSKASVPFTILRPWNVYGPGQRMDDGRVPMEFVRQALINNKITLASNGTPRRCFCHVTDAMHQITSVIGTADRVEAINIGNATEEISILETALKCASACGLPSDRVSYEPLTKANGLQRCAPDTSIIRNKCQIPYAPIGLDQGIVGLTEWCDFLL